MDGNGTLFGTLSGNTREVLHKFTVDLPKKHGRGGQSALRFARLRMEKRHNYVRKVRVAAGGRAGAACLPRLGMRQPAQLLSPRRRRMEQRRRHVRPGSPSHPSPADGMPLTPPPMPLLLPAGG